MEKQLRLIAIPENPHESNDSLETRNPIRNDFNLSRLALFIPSDRKAERFRNIFIEFENVELDETDESTGRRLKATWEVQHSSRLGLPGGFDRDVWLGLAEIIDQITDHGKKECPKRIEFGAFRSFLHRIEKGAGGSDIKRLQESIERLAITVCTSKGAFKCPKLGGYIVGKSFKLLDGWGFIGQPDGNGGVHETNFVEISEYVRQNLHPDGYITLIDVKYIRKLKGELTKQLYLLLSYLFWKAAQRGQTECRLYWRHLSKYLGVVGWSALWRAKDKLKLAFANLKENGYLDESSDWSDDCYVFRAGPHYIEEHITRIKNKDLYATWIQGEIRKNKTRPIQLSILPSEPIAITADEHRLNLLTIQAARKLYGMPIDMEKLRRFDWSEDDLQAAVAKQRQMLCAR
jgi:hypothetical protein